jgi:hypothetical protein
MLSGSKQPPENEIFTEKMRHSTVQKFVYLHTTNKVEVDTTKRILVEIPKDKDSYLAELARAYSVGRDGTDVSSNTRTSKVVPDERFRDLLDLEKKYTGEIKTPKEDIPKVEEELYPLVMTCIREKRIKGEFELPSYRDLELQSINRRIRDLEDRVDRLDLGDQKPKSTKVQGG